LASRGELDTIAGGIEVYAERGMTSRAENEGFRVLDEFVCDAIHEPGMPLGDPGKQGRNEGNRIVEDPMATIVLRLDPHLLENPDADIRYLLPDLLAKRSGGAISDNGYDYVGTEPVLMLFLKAPELTAALECILDVVENVRVLENDLRPAVVVAVEFEGRHQVIFPPGFEGPFIPE
jgi:hypothetical protein